MFICFVFFFFSLQGLKETEHLSHKSTRKILQEIKKKHNLHAVMKSKEKDGIKTQRRRSITSNSSSSSSSISSISNSSSSLIQKRAQRMKKVKTGDETKPKSREKQAVVHPLFVPNRSAHQDKAR